MSQHCTNLLNLRSRLSKFHSKVVNRLIKPVKSCLIWQNTNLSSRKLWPSVFCKNVRISSQMCDLHLWAKWWNSLAIGTKLRGFFTSATDLALWSPSPIIPSKSLHLIRSLKSMKTSKTSVKNSAKSLRRYKRLGLLIESAFEFSKKLRVRSTKKHDE